MNGYWTIQILLLAYLVPVHVATGSFVPLGSRLMKLDTHDSVSAQGLFYRMQEGVLILREILVMVFTCHQNVVKSTEGFPTNPFKILELSNPPHDVAELNKIISIPFTQPNDRVNFQT